MPVKGAFTVAVDGPAAAGKGTISKAVAAHFGFAHLDTGLLYRAVGIKTLEAGEISADRALKVALDLTAEDLQRDDLRSAKAADAASKVAVMPAVRQALVDFQTTFARRDGGAVLDGRDIGTVICPEAEVKLYVTARAEIRAERRFLELQKAGQTTTFARVLEDVKARDERDANRAAAPLKPAQDARLLDTSELSIVEAVREAISEVSVKVLKFSNRS